MSPRSLFCKLTIKKLRKNWHIGDRLLLSVAIRAQWQQPVASVKALNLLYWVMHMVLYRRIAMAREMASKLGTFFIVVVFAVTLAAAEAIQSKCSSSGGIQWLLAKLWTYNIYANVLGITLARQRGHQNGLQWRCSFVALLILISS
jgi:hypothetical protein